MRTGDGSYELILDMRMVRSKISYWRGQLKKSKKLIKRYEGELAELKKKGV